MVTELAAGALEDNAVSLYRQRRHGIGLGARRIERARPGEAGYADYPLDLRVVRLKVGIGNRPIGKGGAGNIADLAVFLEIDFVETPEVGGEVDAAAADATAIENGLLFPGGFLGRLAESDGMDVDLVGEQALDEDFSFVVREIFFAEIFALFEDNHAETVGGEFFRKDASGRAGADDDKIHFVGWLVGDHWPAHFFTVSPGMGCQPG